MTIFGPSAAEISVGGTVRSVSGQPIANAKVSLTDTEGVTRTAISNGFGSFRIDSVPAGATYIMSVAAKRYTFAPRTLTVTDALTDVDVISDN